LQQCMNDLERQYLIYQQRATNVEGTIREMEELYQKALEEIDFLRGQLNEKDSVKVEGNERSDEVVGNLER
jgi:hypothetical protein